MRSLTGVIRGGARRVLGAAGYELAPRRRGPLERLRDAGVAPASVIDVGAALGDWTVECARVFPQARYVLAEPLAEFHGRLEEVARTLARAEVVPAALSDRAGETTLHVHRDLVGSSLLREQEGEHVDGTPRTVTTTSLDELVRERGLQPPFLIKLDVQGAEAQVLAGARETLPGCVAVQLEVSFFSFFHGGAPFDELVATMSEAGLVVYDLGGLSYRPLDGALAQADVLFVPERSPARRRHIFGSPEQRRAQDEEFEATIGRRLAGSSAERAG